MKTLFEHAWKVTPREAAAIQAELSGQIILRDEWKTIRFIGGVDVGFEKGNQVTRAAAVVLRFPELELVEWRIARKATCFPYIPGYLSFREAPAILAALARLETKPDLLACDGHGIAHPRGFGLACHLGLLTGIPSFGVGKKRLVGDHEDLPETSGSHRPLIFKGKTVGYVLRTREGVKPIYVSPGHRIGPESAASFALRCCTRYRLPETTRWAHRFASRPLPGGPSEGKSAENEHGGLQ